MKKTSPFLSRWILAATILAFVVIILGAYTRLTDAGLGCPDWPGCYNHLTAPDTPKALHQATVAFPNAPVHIIKAWTEMIHRYVAGTLGLLIFALAAIVLKRRKQIAVPALVPLLLLAALIFQVVLGKWTVTMKLLPTVVMGHLLGGFTIFALLWWMCLSSGDYFHQIDSRELKHFRPWAIVGLIILIFQIALGGWTSANYAALVCPNFPYCRAHLFFPAVDFKDAFNIFHPFAIHKLSLAALITIQMMHRTGALVTGVYLGLFGFCLMWITKIAALRYLGALLLLVLIVQIGLGILNVVMQLPLSIALAHNGVAALLLLTVVTLTYVIFKNNNA